MADDARIAHLVGLSLGGVALLCAILSALGMPT